MPRLLFNPVEVTDIFSDVLVFPLIAEQGCHIVKEKNIHKKLKVLRIIKNAMPFIDSGESYLCFQGRFNVSSDSLTMIRYR